ncbi:MAG TPA: PSD1 and planctomycete cytochrome C domain-containing protein [Vicinamibacterales bacterium]|nr:PSD1 and planctomycete cytochrome C domain-containing protein [Vicinamibacterales bacterium]
MSGPARRSIGSALALLHLAILTAAIRAQTPADSSPAPSQAQAIQFFEERIRPIFVSYCADCHEDDESGGLRVDSRAALLRGGTSGPAIVPGKPDDSLLMKVVRHASGFPRMPRVGPRLGDEQVAALASWIASGAVWPASAGDPVAPLPSHERTLTAEERAFWAFQPIAPAAVPSVGDTAWPASDIDRFVLARLEAEGLEPVGPADKRALLRRATLDLTGLPPTPEAVDAFLADQSPDGFARVVDRLLASPQYGEAWGRMWLDVARYGEDDYRSLDPMGRGFNPYPNAYLYRDWVIKAFNDDMSWDRFVTAQVAADLDEDADARMRNLPALGFLGLGPWYYDNGAVEITRADERNDRVDAVSRGLLGLTVACARCHDHKYDPILARDYYALAGVFLNTEYHEYPRAPEAVVTAHKTAEKTIEKKEELLADFLTKESKQLAETLAFQAARYMKAAWRVLGDPKADKLRVVDGEKLDFELFERWLRFLAKPQTFYPDLADWQAMIEKGGTAAEADRLATALEEKLVTLVIDKRAIDEENEIIRAQALPGTKPKKPANLPNEFKTNDDFCPGCALELKSLAAERMSLWTDVFMRDLEDEAAPGQPMRPGLLVFRGWGLERQLGPDRRDLVAALRADIKKMRDALPPKYPYVHGVRDLAEPANLEVHLRGNPHQLGDEVARGYLTVLSPESGRVPFTTGSGRLELARRIVAEPIAIRVIVNRIWKGHFGTGIVDTPSNFGINGERPTHPGLLDYLAQRFIDSGLSMKTLHREIMLTTTYQLSDDDQPAASAVDAGNRLYWRANRRRVTAEQLRDSVLFVSGALDTRLGGPSERLTPLYDRRTIYGTVSRYKMDEFLQLFDFPSASQTAEKRFVTSVPLQRLFLMNSDFMQQHAERVAVRVEAEPDDDARIRKTYRLLFGRLPTEAELDAGREYLRAEPMRQYEEQKAASAEAKPAAMVPPPPPPPAPPGPPPAPGADGMMAGLAPGAGSDAERKDYLPVTTFGRYVKVLLSSNEFVFIR